MSSLSLLENKLLNKNISVLPIPLNLGSDNSDTNNAPQYLLDSGLTSALSSLGMRVTKLPAIKIKKIHSTGKEERFQEVVKISEVVREIVKTEIDKGQTILALGGDHAISIGTIAGASQALSGDLGVIWIDAHSDIQTKESSLSKNVHGMPTAAFLGFCNDLGVCVPTKIKKENILYIGLKDLDQFEIDTLRQHNLSAITMFDILQGGFSSVTKAIDILNKQVSNIWISMDMDSIDKQYAPGVALATSGGFTYREVTNLLNYIGKTSSIVGMDVVEISPEKDIDGVTSGLALELIASGFGSKYNWYSSEYMKKYGK